MPSKSTTFSSSSPFSTRPLTYISSLIMLSIRLLGNIVGIDEKNAVDGNDSIEKSSFKLSPAAARVSSSAPKTKKPAPKKKPSSPRKRLFNSHQSSVSEVSDLRLHKRGRTNKETAKVEKFIVVDSDDSDIENPDSLNESEQKETGGQKLVTPSPHPSRRQSHHQQQPPSNTPTPLYNSSRSSSQQGKFGASGRTKSSHFANNTSGKSRAVRNTTSSWFQQKKQQKTSQSSAFNSPKENPFSSYSFDPNSIEKNLDSHAAVQIKEPSIFPSNVAASNFTATKPRNSRTFRTPANRRKNASSSSRISSHDLLQRKANELNQHRHQMTMTTGYNGNHDGASQMSASDPFYQQTFTAGNRYSSGNYDYQSEFSQPYQQQLDHQQHLQNVQPLQKSFQSTFYEDSFDQVRDSGPFRHQYDFPQQIPRPGTSTGSVMTSRSRFMNIPYQQQSVQQQQFNRSQHFMQPQQSRFYEDSFDQGYSVGGNDFPQQMYQRPGTSLDSIQFSQPHQQFSQQQQGPQLNRFQSHFQQDPAGHIMMDQFSQQVPPPHFTQPPNYNTAGDSQHRYMSSAPVQNNQSAPVPNPYLQNRSRAASSVVNPYRQQNQDTNSGPPLEVVVQSEAMHDESASQFEDAFF